MAATRARYIADLLRVHAEDLAFVWSQRREALTSSRHTLREFNEINERIEAHTQGLLVAPPDALVDLFVPALGAEDRDEAFAAAYALLRAAQPQATRTVLAEFSRAAGPTLAGLRDALGFAPPQAFVGEMQSAFERAKPLTAASAAVVLANHRLLDGAAPRLVALLQQDDPVVCELAWRAALVADSKAGTAASQRRYDDALAHPAAGVRHAIWAARAWAADGQTLLRLRDTSAKGDPVAVQWLAVLGTEEDVTRIKEAALAADAAPLRCALLARFGHPMAVNALLRWMDGDDVGLAVAAREAFTRITGLDIRGERRTMPVPADADEFEREMAPDVWLPDVRQARSLVERHAAEWAQGQRWCNGVRVDGEVPREALAQFDFEARWDLAARAALDGRRISAPAPIC